jgi:DNA polymerase-3 subunit delta
MRNLGIKNFYAARDYITALRNYNAFKTMYIISLIRETDARSKGFGGNFPPDELLRECVFKILHM